MAATGITAREELAFRRNALDGKTLTPKQREDLLRPHLPRDFSPSPPSSPRRTLSSRSNLRNGTVNGTASSKQRPRLTPIRTTLHILLHHLIALLFSVFFRFRRSWRLLKYKVLSVMQHHHHTPEWIVSDVKNLEQLPKHLSVVLDLREGDEDQGTAGLEGLVNDVCEIAAWTASAGIPVLSVYERTGVLKNYVPQTYAAVQRTLEVYFGAGRRRPTLTVKAPHTTSYSPPDTPDDKYNDDDDNTSRNPAASQRPHLMLLLLSEHDGRATIVDLTVTLAQMAQKGDVHVSQIDSALIDAELNDHVSTEPDLVVLFSPSVTLRGYPPWQLRLAEIFHLPDNKGVNYQVFLQALKKFGKAEFRVGR